MRSRYPSIRPFVIVDDTIVDNTSIDSRFIRGIKGLEEIVIYSFSRLIISGISIISRVYSLDNYIVVGYKGLILYSSNRERFSKVFISLLLRNLVARICFLRGLSKLGTKCFILGIYFKGYRYKIVLG